LVKPALPILIIDDPAQPIALLLTLDPLQFVCPFTLVHWWS
jgi:hypothetical protein